MEAAELLKVFSDPSQIKNLTTMQLLWGGLFTAILGMGITFTVLIVLLFVISLFKRFSGPDEPKPTPKGKPGPKTKPAVKKTEEQPVLRTDDGLVPAITASIAMMLGTAASNIRIRDIRRVADTLPVWHRAGIAEQMQTRI